MPRIPDALVDAIVYLYPSADEAQRGATRDEPGWGATGFLVDFPVEDAPADMRVTYVVTASHVVGPEGQSRVLRLNTQDGGTEIIETDEANWVHHPDGDDVAAYLIALSPARLRYKCLDWETFAVTPTDLEQWHVGPGDEVIYVGRFRLQEGRRRNLPTTRSGIISRMPLDEGVANARGIAQESFIVEARSMGGYSGSPVFLYIPPFSWRGSLDVTELDSSSHFALLGIDWGHRSDLLRVLGPTKTPVGDELWVQQNSGLMMVVPAWRIDQLLRDEDRMKATRRLALDTWRRKRVSVGFGATSTPIPAESLTPPTSIEDEPTSSRADPDGG